MCRQYRPDKKTTFPALLFNPSLLRNARLGYHDAEGAGQSFLWVDKHPTFGFQIWHATLASG